jgi:hypothetical protein
MKRNRISKTTACLVICLFLTSCSREDSKYVPSIDNGNGSYRFSKAQLAEMARTPLDRSMFVQYVEAKWPLDKLKAYCTKANLLQDQNLVPQNLCFDEWEIPVHNSPLK